MEDDKKGLLHSYAPDRARGDRKHYRETHSFLKND
jgi:hypothetical protein